MAFDLIDDGPSKQRDLCVALQKLRCREHDRSLHVGPPVVLTRIALAAGFLARVGARSVQLLGVGVVDDRDGVAAGAAAVPAAGCRIPTCT